MKQKAKSVNPENATETKQEKFKRLAEARTSAALHKIEQLGNLTGSNYEYDSDQAKQILSAMFDAVHDLKRKFEKAQKKQKDSSKGFTFSETSKSATAA